MSTLPATGRMGYSCDDCMRVILSDRRKKLSNAWDRGCDCMKGRPSIDPDAGRVPLVGGDVGRGSAPTRAMSELAPGITTDAG